MEPIGPYSLRRRLGETPGGELHEAIDRGAGRPVLVELVRDDLFRDDAARQIWRASANRLAALELGGVAQVVEVLEASGRVGLVSRMPEGRWLRGVLDEAGRVPWDAAGALVGTVSRTVARLHAESPAIAHLDLRPDRIWILADGEAVVVTAAAAELAADSSVAAARSVELLRYAAPELLDGAAVGPATDAYGLGIMLYELLAGHPPFQSSSPRTLINMQCAEQPPPLPESVRAATPRALLSLLAELLQKQPGERPALSTLAQRLEDLVPARASPWLAVSPPANGAASSAPSETRPRGETGAAERATELGGSTASGDAAAQPSEPSAEPGEESVERGDEPPQPRADKQLTFSQIGLLVAAATLLAALLAYCAVRGSPGGLPDETAPPVTGRPLAPDQDSPPPPTYRPLGPDFDRPPQDFPSAPDQPSPDRMRRGAGGAAAVPETVPPRP